MDFCPGPSSSGTSSSKSTASPRRAKVAATAAGGASQVDAGSCVWPMADPQMADTLRMAAGSAGAAPPEGGGLSVDDPPPRKDESCGDSSLDRDRSRMILSGLRVDGIAERAARAIVVISRQLQ